LAAKKGTWAYASQKELVLSSMLVIRIWQLLYIVTVIGFSLEHEANISSETRSIMYQHSWLVVLQLGNFNLQDRGMTKEFIVLEHTALCAPYHQLSSFKIK
jgi:hypothetical protein